ncbi:hypothetical protein BBJ28_00013293 [Nothophytophthora sp. Chile5]|nr:hypothetical protein BBJ28_00013293 [Nothophytophthora sp. Chile5]
MADKKQPQLPLPTPVAEPGFVGSSESPSNGDYVTVLTPDNKSAPGPESAEFDPSGLRMQLWTRALHDADLRTAYYWWVCCCPCAPLAQLETRLGLGSYATGLLVNLTAYTGRLVFLLLALICLFSGCFSGFAISLVLFIVCLLWVAHRVARVRILTRERLDIAGSAKDDRYTGCCRSTSAIRQMAAQLKCDQVHFGAPTTLQAYQV